MLEADRGSSRFGEVWPRREREAIQMKRHPWAVIFLILLATGCDVSSILPFATRSWTLHQAAYMGDVAAVKRFLRKGADIDGKTDLFPCTPLHLAVAGRQEEVVKVLLEHGARPDVPDDFEGATPLHKAAGEGYLAIVTLLVAYGEDPNAIRAPGSEERLKAEAAAGEAIPEWRKKLRIGTPAGVQVIQKWGVAQEDAEAVLDGIQTTHVDGGGGSRTRLGGRVSAGSRG